MRPVLVLAAILSLAGCALSPQVVDLTPTLVLPPGNVGAGRIVNVQVIDERDDTAIGSRGGVYAGSSTIKAGNDVAAVIRDALEKGLVAQGYVIGSTNADAVLHVGVQKLSYVVPKGAVATSADITVSIGVTAERGERKLATGYRSTVTHRFPVAPTAEQNEIWINEVLSATLARFFADQQMREFLTR
ncbi:MAG: YajG family lipoprotein [Pseudomonadota bacterium]